MIDVIGVERRRAALGALGFLAFAEKKLSEIGPLPVCDSCYKGSLKGFVLSNASEVGLRPCIRWTE